MRLLLLLLLLSTARADVSPPPAPCVLPDSLGACIVTRPASSPCGRRVLRFSAGPHDRAKAEAEATRALLAAVTKEEMQLFRRADELFEQVLTPIPAKLDKRVFTTWLAERSRRIREAQQAYMQRQYNDLKLDAIRVARIAQMFHSFASEIASADVFPSSDAELRKAYCAALADQVTAIEQKAVESYHMCRSIAERGPFPDVDSVCRLGLHALDVTSP
jgi:hypothetical protein